MRLFKPPWVSHDGKPIFAIDIHPDGSRFATGGQGDGGSSGVIIWNMTPVINKKDEVNDKVPKVLCVMDNHLACVNAVRWSCNGRYLASGGDDRLIMIWQFAGYGRVGAFGGSENLKSSSVGERWRCTHTLKHHTGDILDLAWSPGNQWLASCSIDNTVVVWNVEKFPEVTAVLKDHTSLVKGVTWDPIGSYLASQSDDKTIKVWKTLDWKLESTITKPFVECTATTHVLRLSWSPDGGHLVSAHAMNNSGPTAQIIDREGWKTDMDFVGHRKAITCTRFNGCVFSKIDKDSKSLQYTCCVVGSRDRSVSVWLTSLKRPLVVIHDLFDDSVLDLSWSFDGYSLFCCSCDGTVAFMQFDKAEIGTTLTQEEKNTLHKETYGKTCIGQKPLIIENPAMLEIQQKKNNDSINNTNKPNSKSQTTPIKYNTKQIETRTPSGKRRIIPVFVAPQEALGGIPTPFGSSNVFAKNLLKSAEKLNNISKLTQSPIKLSSSPSKSPKIMSTESKELPKTKPDSTLKTEESKKKNEVQNHHPQENAQQKKRAVLDNRLIEKGKQNEGNKATSAKSLQFSKEPPKIKSQTKDGPASLQTNINSDEAEVSSPRRPGRPPMHIKRKQVDAISPVRKKPHKQIRRERTRTSETIPKTSALILPEILAQSSKVAVAAKSVLPTYLLHPKKLCKRISVRCTHYPGVSVNVANSLSEENEPIVTSLHRICCTADKVEKWGNVLSSPVLVLSVSKELVGAGCHDKTIHIYSLLSGRRKISPICANDSVWQMCCEGHHLMVIDIGCRLSVWDLKQGKSVMTEKSFAHLFSADVNEDNLQNHSLTKFGIPLLTFTNQKSYSFNIDLNSWVLISSPGNSIEQFSKNISTSNTVDSAHFEHEKNILSTFNKKLTTGIAAHASHLFQTSPNSQKTATLANFEQKIEACIVLQSISEYRKWLRAYVIYLVEEHLELRLREMCDNLIGLPSDRSRRHHNMATWKTSVLAVQKRILLQEEILPIIGSNLSFQRLYTEYNDQLDDTDG